MHSYARLLKEPFYEEAFRTCLKERNENTTKTIKTIKFYKKEERNNLQNSGFH